MKKMIVFLAALIVAATTFGQDAEKSVKKAKSAYFAFTNATNQLESSAKLVEAAAAIEEAITYPENQAVPGVWLRRGQIYAEMIKLESMALQFGKPYRAPTEAGMLAYKSFIAAKEKGAVKADLRDLYEGMPFAVQGLSNTGDVAAKKADYSAAFDNYNALIDANDFLKSNGKDAPLADSTMIGVIDFTISCANAAKRLADARPLIDRMYNQKKGSDTPAVYDALFNLTKEVKYLEEGRARYPNETSLLFSEINYYLGLGKLDVLIDKLKLGIEKEPTNMQLYLTLGSVYDQLANQVATGPTKDLAKAKEYGASALALYNQVLGKDPNNFDAIYSIGTYNYNQAAMRNDELRALESDMTKAGMAKYDAKLKEVVDAFEVALPFFQKAEGINPNDKNVLIALKEIYAKKDDRTLSDEFKKRLENVEGGGKNTSYFKK